MPLRSLSNWSPSLTIGLACALGAFAWWLVRRESAKLAGPSAWLLPTLRAGAITLIAMTLAEPAWETVQRQGTPGTVVFLLDNSQSMALTDQPAEAEQNAAQPADRFERASALLLGERDGLMAQLADRFDVRAFASGTNGGLLELDTDAQDPRDWRPGTWPTSTQLGDALKDLSQTASQREANTVFVLLTDGQNNAGTSLIETAREFRSLDLPIFTIGYGISEQTDDLNLKSARTGIRYYREDMLTGTLAVSEHVPDGTSYRAELLLQDQVLWDAELKSIAAQDRSIRFSVPVQDLLATARQTQASDVTIANLSARLTARLVLENERNVANNSLSLFTNITAQQARILLIDGRSRWETRYLKNMFSRDPAWELVTAIPGPDGSLGRQDSTDAEGHGLPASREDLAEFNLVILGDIPASAFEPQFLEWLRDYLETGQGGLILVDGARANLASEAYQQLRDAFPVEWTAAGGVGSFTPELTPAGENLGALQLSEEPGAPKPWQPLPVLPFVASTKPLPGAELLAVARSSEETRPLLVSRLFGAGRVLYVASDETWRWRYKVADQVHTRLWNQLASWTMRKPLSLQSDFLGLDTGAPSYAVGDTVEILAELRDAAGKPASDRSAVAVILDASGVVARLPLAEVESFPGRYRGISNHLPSGDYRVRIEASGFPADALALESQFSVVASDNLEFQETVCNERLLHTVSQQTGGQYFHESQAAQISAQLRPLSGGQIQTRSIIIWQSYAWFTAAIFLLTIEWLLRKRAGFI